MILGPVSKEFSSTIHPPTLYSYTLSPSRSRRCIVPHWFIQNHECTYTNRILPCIGTEGFGILHWPSFLVACVKTSTVGRRLVDPIVWYRDTNQSHYISMWSTLNEAIHKLMIRLLSKFALLTLWYEAKW